MEVLTEGLTEEQAAVFKASGDSFREHLGFVSRDGPPKGMSDASRVAVSVRRQGDSIDLEVALVDFDPKEHFAPMFYPYNGCALLLRLPQLIGYAAFSWRRDVAKRVESGNPVGPALLAGAVVIRFVHKDKPLDLLFAMAWDGSAPRPLSPIALASDKGVAYVEPATGVATTLYNGTLLLDRPGGVDLDGNLKPYNYVYDFFGPVPENPDPPASSICRWPVPPAPQ